MNSSYGNMGGIIRSICRDHLFKGSLNNQFFLFWAAV
jgi:hypothetical protein